MKHRIAICVDYFEPGYRGGGCLRAVSHLVRHFAKEMDLQVLTRDRDLGMGAPYAEIDQSRVMSDLGCEIRYLPAGSSAFPALLQALRAFRPDMLHLNSVFSPMFTLWPLLVARRMATGILLAPRGELLSGALASKGSKKKIFLGIARGSGIYRGLHWHATCSDEADAIARLRLGSNTIHVAEDLPGPPVAVWEAPRKVPGHLDVLFLARLHPMKGLDRLLQWLPRVPGDLCLRIAGPEVDASYVETCRRLAQALPERIRVEWLGAIPHEAVLNEFGRAHVYVLPTQTENNGYTIQESLGCGCPVLTSQGTPWKDLAEHGAGWTLPLEDSGAWSQTLQGLVNADAEAHRAQRERSLAYGQRSLRSLEAVSATRAMFEAVMAGKR